MIAYLKDFLHYNRNNEVGFGLLIITTVVTALYVAVIIAVSLQGGEFGFGWWAMLPLVLWFTTITHFVIRPLASRAYSNN